MWFVYILLCQDSSLYTGVTNNLQKRFLEHQNGRGGHYTRSHRPIKLIFQEPHPTHSSALRREHQIKSWPRSKKITDLKLNI